MDANDRSIRPDELLTQLGWVRALARSLVFDPDLADDVLQQVCLLALQQAPRDASEGPRLRAWLASVTRSLVRRSARTDSRRVRREQSAARAEAQPSTAEIAQHREALRALVDAVTSLDEPYGSTVVERYFQGLSVAEIAERHRITEVGVRQRLSRARQQLRVRLERLIDDEPSGWLASVLPLAPAAASHTGASLTGASTASAASAASSASSASHIPHRGGLTLGQQAGWGGATKLVLGLLVAVGLFTLTVRWMPPGQVGEPTLAAAPAVEPPAPPAQPIGRPPELALGSQKPLAPSGGAPPPADGDLRDVSIGREVVYRGRCVTDAGLPIAGASIDLAGSTNTAIGIPDRPDQRLLVGSTRSDSDGRFELRGLVPPGLDPNQRRKFLERINLPLFEASAPGVLPAWVTAPPTEGPATDVGDLVLATGGGLSLTVRAAGGGSIASLSVQLDYQDKIETSGHLACRLIHEQRFTPERIELAPLPIGTVRVELKGQGCSPTTIGPFEIGPGALVDGGVVELQRGALLSGSVVDRSQRPIAGAWVAITPDANFSPLPDDPVQRCERAESIRNSWAGCLELVTDAQGVFRTESLAPGRYSVAAGGERCVATLTSFVPAPGPPVVLALEPEGGTLLRCVDAQTRAPIAPESVSIFNGKSLRVERLEPEAASALAPAQQASAVYRLPPTADAVLVRSAGYPLQACQLARPAQGEVRDETLGLVPACYAHGSVTDAAGTPLPGRLVLAENELLSRFEEHNVSTRTDADGRFRIGPLAQGTWSLRAGGGSFVECRKSVQLDGNACDPDVPLVLKAGARVGGRVTDASGRAVEGRAVFLKALGVLGDVQAQTDAQGEFAFAQVTPGRSTLTTTLPAVSARVDLAAGESKWFELALPAPARVSGLVRSAGRPIVGATLTLLTVQSLAFRGPAPRTYTDFAETTTDDRGAYAFDLAEGGDYAVVATAPFGSRGPRLDFTAAPGSDVVVDLALPELELLGRVVAEATGEPLAGVVVELRLGEVTVCAPPTSADGRFAFPCLAAGSALVQAGARGFGRVGRPIELRPDAPQPASAILALSPAAGLEGEVKSADGSVPGGDLHLRLSSLAEPGFVRVEDVRAGRYRVDDLAPGAYAGAVVRRVIVDFLQTEDVVLFEAPVQLEAGRTLQRDWIVPIGR